MRCISIVLGATSASHLSRICLVPESLLHQITVIFLSFMYRIWNISVTVSKSYTLRIIVTSLSYRELICVCVVSVSYLFLICFISLSYLHGVWDFPASYLYRFWAISVSDLSHVWIVSWSYLRRICIALVWFVHRIWVIVRLSYLYRMQNTSVSYLHCRESFPLRITLISLPYLHHIYITSDSWLSRFWVISASYLSHACNVSTGNL